MVSSICKEVEDRSSYLQEEVRTIYFGGGTPSLLTYLQIESILSSVHNHFSIAKNVEITLEANPEDLNVKKLGELRSVGINRLSIGIQTFNNEKLKWMNRAHSSDQATNAYLQARKAGFENISLDLIYARPDEDAGAWTNDLHKIVELNPEHISLYGLTIEDKTVFRKWEKEHKLIQLPEEDGSVKIYVNVKDTYNNVGIASTGIIVKDKKAKKKKYLVPKGELPFYVYKENNSLPYAASGYMGNIDAISVDLNYKEDVHSGEKSIKIKYDSRGGWYGVAFQDPANDWGSILGGYDISGAKTIF